MYLDASKRVKNIFKKELTKLLKKVDNIIELDMSLNRDMSSPNCYPILDGTITFRVEGDYFKQSKRSKLK